MPELPDIAAYISALEPRILGQTLERVRVHGVFLVRSVDPPLSAAEGQRVRELRRIGKRIAFLLDNKVAIVLHLMIAGRLHWKPPAAKIELAQKKPESPAPPPVPAMSKSDDAVCAAIDAYKKRQLAAIESDRKTLAALQSAISQLGLNKQLDFMVDATGNLNIPVGGASHITPASAPAPVKN